MKNALGHLTVALVFGAIWPFMVSGHAPVMPGSRFDWLLVVLRQVLAQERDLTTIVLVMVLIVAQYLAVVGLAALLQPLGRAVLQAWRHWRITRAPSRGSGQAAGAGACWNAHGSTPRRHTATAQSL